MKTYSNLISDMFVAIFQGGSFDKSVYDKGAFHLGDLKGS